MHPEPESPGVRLTQRQSQEKAEMKQMTFSQLPREPSLPSVSADGHYNEGGSTSSKFSSISVKQ